MLCQTFEKSINLFVRLVWLKNNPIFAVEDEDYRQFCRLDVAISRKQVVFVPLELVILVEKLISNEVQATPGAVIYDDRSHGSIHRVDIITSYCTVLARRIGGAEQIVSVPRVTLLGISPMDPEKLDDQYSIILSLVNDNYEATSFNAVKHIYYFQDTLSFCYLDFKRWVECFIVENTATNFRVARLVSEPHFGCYSHKLNLHQFQSVQEYLSNL